MNQELQEAVDKARKLEIDGADFYTDAAEKCQSAAGTRMFESFAGDERRHLRVVKDLAEGLGVDMSDQPMPAEQIKTLFSEKRSELEQIAAPTVDEKEAIETAMGMETQSFQLYEEAARSASEEKTRELFERLSQEEHQHYRMLENTLEYLQDNQEWFLWQEGALLTGDMSSLGGG